MRQRSTWIRGSPNPDPRVPDRAKSGNIASGYQCAAPQTRFFSDYAFSDVTGLPIVPRHDLSDVEFCELPKELHRKYRTCNNCPITSLAATLVSAPTVWVGYFHLDFSTKKNLGLSKNIWKKSFFRRFFFIEIKNKRKPTLKRPWNNLA